MEAEIILAIAIVGGLIFQLWWHEVARRKRKEYYSEYLKTDAWQRKRYVVLKRDNWICVHCGNKAT